MPLLTSLRRSVASGLTGLALVASAAVISPGTASADIALCNVNKNTWVREAPGLGTRVLYTIPEGGGFRVEDGPALADNILWWYGHGNGRANGWVPDQNLYNCH
jgi:hypothetical protein